MQNTLLVASRNRPTGALAVRADGSEPDLAPSDLAVRVLTDFASDYPLTVDSELPIDDALADMARFGVRALLATREDSESGEREIAGLVTSYDIEGPRALRFLQASKHSRRPDIHVSRVMTPWDDLSLLDYDSLRSMTVAELYEMFQGTGLTHVLVVEMDGNAPALVRGLISRAALTRRLRSIGATGLA